MIYVQEPGLLTTVQDAGRYGYQHQGVPVSGAMDVKSLRLANILLGNQETEAALECTLSGPTIEFQENCMFAITGADMQPQLSGLEIKMYKVYLAKKGDVLKLGFAKNGARSYIAFAGGLKVPSVMGSKSTNIKCRIGGFAGRGLKRGDAIELQGPKETLPNLYKRYEDMALEDTGNETVIRVVEGPQSEYFTNEGKETFYTKPYKIRQESDRMGYRFEGEKIAYKDSVDIISDGIAFGSVQVTSSGMPIVMMADHQTTGGYAKIATVISADLPVLAQMVPGQFVRFHPVTLKEAKKCRHAQEKAIHRFYRHTN